MSTVYVSCEGISTSEGDMISHTNGADGATVEGHTYTLYTSGGLYSLGIPWHNRRMHMFLSPNPYACHQFL